MKQSTVNVSNQEKTLIALDIDKTLIAPDQGKGIQFVGGSSNHFVDWLAVLQNKVGVDNLDVILCTAKESMGVDDTVRAVCNVLRDFLKIKPESDTSLTFQWCQYTRGNPIAPILHTESISWKTNKLYKNGAYSNNYKHSEKNSPKQILKSNPDQPYIPAPVHVCYPAYKICVILSEAKARNIKPSNVYFLDDCALTFRNQYAQYSESGSEINYVRARSNIRKSLSEITLLIENKQNKNVQKNTPIPLMTDIFQPTSKIQEEIKTSSPMDNETTISNTGL